MLNQLPSELKNHIYEYIPNELYLYWKYIFSRYVLSKINIKSYFNSFILNHINKGWRLVSIFYTSCSSCPFRNFDNYKYCIYCKKELIPRPCLNCYWSNLDPYNNYNLCYCSNIVKLISWNEIKYFYPQYKYNSYYDFLKGQEWKNFLNREFIIKYPNSMIYN